MLDSRFGVTCCAAGWAIAVIAVRQNEKYSLPTDFTDGTDSIVNQGRRDGFHRRTQGSRSLKALSGLGDLCEPFSIRVNPCKPWLRIRRVGRKKSRKTQKKRRVSNRIIL